MNCIICRTRPAPDGDLFCDALCKSAYRETTRVRIVDTGPAWTPEQDARLDAIISRAVRELP